MKMGQEEVVTGWYYECGVMCKAIRPGVKYGVERGADKPLRPLPGQRAAPVDLPNPEMRAVRLYLMYYLAKTLPPSTCF